MYNQSNNIRVPGRTLLVLVWGARVPGRTLLVLAWGARVPGRTLLVLAWGARVPGRTLVVWLGGPGSWAGPFWFGFGGARVLGPDRLIRLIHLTVIRMLI